MPLELLSPFIEKIIDWFIENRKSEKFYRNYLSACLGETEKLQQKWLDSDGFFSLNTLEAFIPVHLYLEGIHSETMSLKSVLSQNRRIVVMGLAGAGKSTLARYIAAILASALMGDKELEFRMSREMGIEKHFPIYVDLVACNEKELEEVLFSSACNFRDTKVDTKALIEDKLIKGNCFVIFDGLDEIINGKQRLKVMREIASISKRHSDQNYFMVTTRPGGYNRKEELSSVGYRHYELAEWRKPQQERLIRRYYRLWSEKGLGPVSVKDWKTGTDDLMRTIQGNEGLRRLKNNPLMLSIITYLHFRGEVMPEQEYKVYEKILRYLIRKKTQDDDISDDAISDILFMLGGLAFYMLERKERELINKQDLFNVLQKGYHVRDPKEYIKRMEIEWGILLNRNDASDEESLYSFISQSFQIYLAAYSVDRSPQLWHRLQRHLQKTYEVWEEVALMYASMSIPNEKMLKVDRVLQTILDKHNIYSHVDTVVWIRAGRCIASAGKAAQKSKEYDAVLKQLKQLSYGGQKNHIRSIETLCMIHPEGENFILKRIMGHLSHENFDITIWHSLEKMTDLDAIQHLRFVIVNRLEEFAVRDRISLGKALAIIGDDRLERFVLLHSDPNSRFEIGKYPVTNWEYGRFIKETSYPPPSHWPDKEYQKEIANHPVVHVSWEDARAYCKWITEETGIETRLPNEEEWMYAAHGGGNFKYPWESSRIGEMYLNYRHNLEGTTPVGIYHEGESPLGVRDMMGNVWEWTSNKKGGKVILKGGAWDTYEDELAEGILTQKLEKPTLKANNIGFRVIRRYEEIY